MGLRYIHRPKDVELEHPETGEKLPVPAITFKSFVLRFLNHERFKHPIESLYAALSIMKEVVRSPEAASVFVLAENDWKLLCDVIKQEYANIFNEYNSLALVQLAPFFDAVLKASNDPPSE